MKTSFFFFLVFLLLSCHNQQSKTIQFKPVAESELNYPADSGFIIPHGKAWEERKRIHDSCMESSYAANAILIRTRDNIPVGTILNMKTMKVNAKSPLFNGSLPNPSYLYSFNFKPCYEKRRIEVPIDSFLNRQIHFNIDSINDKINKELIEAVRHPFYTEIESDSWMNMELNNGLGKVLDTTTNSILLTYRKELLQPDNIILVRSSSVTEISFYFHTKSPLSANLIKKLMTKPVSAEQEYFKAQFFYINPNLFKLKLNGFFQAFGQFMKCVEE